MDRIKILITIKTYPIPSSKYDELVCTAGVTEAGDFVRLYPINFRELDYAKKYQKYQWMEVLAERHIGRDVRKESFRPDTSSIKMLGEPLTTDDGLWTTRARYVLAKKAQSMEELEERKKLDRTSMGIFQPATVRDLKVTPSSSDCKDSFKAALNQQRLWENRSTTRQPPRKVPWKFQYCFECDDPRCKKNHRIMIEDWELGALYWREVDRGATAEEAAKSVRHKFLEEICSPLRDTYFFAGTVLAYGTWVIVGTFWPKRTAQLPLLKP
jgi:hypothetical protein